MHIAMRIAAFARQHHPTFRFSTLRINNNYAAPLHADSNNQGPSLLVAVGEFTGGRIWISEEGGPDLLVVDRAVRKHDWEIGSSRPGRWHQVGVDQAPEGLMFDGTTPHAVEPYVGERYSIVFFTVDTKRAVPFETKTALESLGFPLPDSRLEGRGRDPLACALNYSGRTSRTIRDFFRLYGRKQWAHDLV